MGSADDTGWVGEATVCSGCSGEAGAGAERGLLSPPSSERSTPPTAGPRAQLVGDQLKLLIPALKGRGLRAALGRCSLSQQAPGCLQNELDYSAQARQRARLQGSPLPTSSASAPVSFPCCFNLGLSPLPVTSCHYLGAHQLLPWEPHPPRFSGLSWVLKV